MNILCLIVDGNFRKLGFFQHGWGNGYIGVPKDHPWYGKGYDSIEADVHGGLTYASYDHPNGGRDGNWWIGFDTFHAGDNFTDHDKVFVEDEVKRLKEQALAEVGRSA